VADRSGHAPHLAVPSFAKLEFDPGRRNRLAHPDRRVAGPEPIRLGHALRTGGQGGAVVQHDAVPQELQAGIVRDALDLH
jgi:hypothetical protein